MNRAITTLFMLMSVDGKISTGSTDEFDVDKDFPNIEGLKEGLHQYYEIEKTTDLWSFNTGRVQAKMGVNQKEYPPKSPVSFVLLDNQHLTEHGIRYFCAESKNFVLITQNPNHPAFLVNEDNLHIIQQDTLNLTEMLEILKQKFGCERLTIQSGGTVNGLFLRNKLIDYVDIVVAPVLIGGKETVTLIDGQSITSKEDLNKLGILTLDKCKVLEDSYIRLRYRVGKKEASEKKEVALIDHLDKLHTTKLGAERIKGNLSLNIENVVDWCKEKIQDDDAVISRKGKNWYINIENYVITVNAHSFTIITAHLKKNAKI